MSTACWADDRLVSELDVFNDEDGQVRTRRAVRKLPCDEPGLEPLGLCRRHHLEITGRDLGSGGEGEHEHPDLQLVH